MELSLERREELTGGSCSSSGVALGPAHRPAELQGQTDRAASRPGLQREGFPGRKLSCSDPPPLASPEPRSSAGGQAGSGPERHRGKDQAGK